VSRKYSDRNMQVIEKFKKNDYNCLVATSIGEEGLDIGEVDFIIIYNCPKTSIKAVRCGKAHVSVR
jgi:ATP-dependent DNA helicase MPH1